MKTQQRRPWNLTFARQALPAGMKKATLPGGRIGVVAFLILLTTSMVSLPARANLSAQSTGYWRYVETTNVQGRDGYVNGKGYKAEISEVGGSYYQELPFNTTLEFKCTWAITHPTSLDKLIPGDTVEAKASCTDTSQRGPDAGGGGSTLVFAITAPDEDMVFYGEASEYHGEVFRMGFGYLESQTTVGKWIVPTYPFQVDKPYRIALRFDLGGTWVAGYTQRIYEWVPEEALVPSNGASPVPTVTETVPLVTQPSGAGTCTATLSLKTNITPGQNIKFTVSVVDDKNHPVTPQNETWLYNGGAFKNGSNQWDGKAAMVEYQYTCPLDGQRLSAFYSIPSQDDGSGWILVVGMGAAGFAAVVSVAAGAVLIATGSNKNTKPGKRPQPPKYILQLSAVNLKVKPRQQSALNIQAWRITPDGRPVAAPDAEIKVLLPSSPTGLVVSPGEGRGSLNCAFFIPKPTICADLMVTVIASAAGATVRAQVKVSIVPVYDLKLEWNGTPPGLLQPGGKEVYARASLSAEPQPDAQTTPDVLVGKISLAVQGPNQGRVELLSALPARQGSHPQNGFLWIPVTVLPPDPGTSLQPGNPSLVASFTVDDQRLEQRLALELGGELVLGAWVQGKKHIDVIYNRKLAPAAWDFSEIRAYFHEPKDENTPVQPTFRYQIDPNTVEFNPPVLEVKEIFPHAKDQYTIRVKQNEGIDLDTYFPADSTTSQKSIDVTITVVGENNKKLTATIKYTLRPTVVFCVHSFDQDPAIPGGHTYRQIALKPMALVTNADDSLNLAGYFARTDQFINGIPDPSKALGVGKVTEITWRNQKDSDDFGELNPETATYSGTFLKYILKTQNFVETLPERLSREHVLAFKAALLPQFVGQYKLETETTEIKLAPEYLRLRLWVVPGTRRHTSEALAYLYLLPSRAPLSEQEVYLAVESPNGMALSLDGCDGKQITSSRGTTSAYGPGMCIWTLRYSGITWENMSAAGFTVRCGLQNPPDETWLYTEYFFNVYVNMRKVLGALTDDAMGATAFSKEINNPAFEPKGMELDYSLPMESGIAENFKGPIWNISKLFQSAPYVCSDLRDKVGEWLRQYRFYQKESHVKSSLERMKSMNGIDFGFYALTPIHVWAGIFPAGADRFAEYRALDPWWQQKWDDQWRSPENLWTQADEDFRLLAMRSANLLLASAVIHLMPSITLAEAIDVVRAYLKGATADQLNALIKEKGQIVAGWFHYLLYLIDCVNTDTQEYSGSAGMITWFREWIKDLD